MDIREIDWQALRLRPPPEAIRGDLPGVWWVAHTRPRCEKALACDLWVRDIPTYLPLRQKMTRSRRTGRRSWSLVPVFTGYLFFNGNDDERVQALTTNRIVTVLPVADQASLVRQLRDVQTVLSRSNDVECGPKVTAGDWVRVVSGPLAGVTGRVQRALTNLRLALNVDILAQSVLVEVARDLIERIDSPPVRREPRPALRGT